MLAYFPDLFTSLKLMDNGEVDGDIGFYSSLTRPLESLNFLGVKSKMFA